MSDDENNSQYFEVRGVRLITSTRSVFILPQHHVGHESFAQAL
jgi:hypothetical protein